MNFTNFNVNDTENDFNLSDWNNKAEQYNPWKGKFALQQKIEVGFLGLIAVVGTLGNLLVIFSIALANRSQKNGNQFIINLAIADLMISGISIPLIIANVVATENVLPPTACRIVGYVMSMSCTCSIWNLSGIALNRYWAVARHYSYKKVFAKSSVIIMLILIWVYCFLVYIPTFFHPYPFDADSMQCSWDPYASPIYNIILLVGGLNIPFIIIAYSYWGVIRTVQKSEASVRGHCKQSSTPIRQQIHHQAMKRRMDLLRTLAVTTAAFLAFWLPYGVIHGLSLQVTPILGKYFAWLGASNSTINFIIYGVMNPLFRNDYKNCLVYLAHLGRQRYSKGKQCQRPISTSHRRPTLFTNFLSKYNTPKHRFNDG